MKTAVYRHRDMAGRTLYIGASANPHGRFTGHRSTSEWAFDVARIDVEWFPTREDALREEARLIDAERPPFNKEWQSKKGRKGWPFNRGHEVLAAWRRRDGVSVSEFARRAGIQIQSAQKFCTTLSHPQTPAKVRIAVATGGCVPRDAWCRANIFEGGPLGPEKAAGELREILIIAERNPRYREFFPADFFPPMGEGAA